MRRRAACGFENPAAAGFAEADRGTIALQGYDIAHPAPEGELTRIAGPIRLDVQGRVGLETLPRYLVPQERELFGEFQAGGTIPVMADDPGGWLETIRNANARGARMRRVHVITEPLSDYLRFEFAAYYLPNTAAGEEIRILDLGQTGPLDLPSFDYWRFDETDAVHMLYEADEQTTLRLLTSARRAESDYRSDRLSTERLPPQASRAAELRSFETQAARAESLGRFTRRRRMAETAEHAKSGQRSTMSRRLSAVIGRFGRSCPSGRSPATVRPG